MNETMFKRLFFAGEGDEGFDELVDQGYFTKIEDTYCRTQKFLDETQEYINVKKNMVYKAIQKLGGTDDIPKIMERTGIKDYITFIFLVEDLRYEGKIIRQEGNKWVAR